jgi:hypothetical protein
LDWDLWNEWDELECFERSKGTGIEKKGSRMDAQGYQDENLEG